MLLVGQGSRAEDGRRSLMRIYTSTKKVARAPVPTRHLYNCRLERTGSVGTGMGGRVEQLSEHYYYYIMSSSES